jgi:hypothetical protein
MTREEKEARKTEVQVGHWLLSNVQNPVALLPEQVMLCVDRTPRSAGKDLMLLRWLYQGLDITGTRLFDVLGAPDRLQFGKPEHMAYGVVAHFVDSASEGLEAPIEMVTRFKIASAAIDELVHAPICVNCNGTGCRACSQLGHEAWTDDKRRKEVDTTSARWGGGRLRLMHMAAIRDAATAQRQATLAFVGAVKTTYPRRWHALLKQFAKKR